ncbi:ion transporter [Robiginitalea sp. IMCC44478]|uniref:ion transporter n=1 Tax=Robiginitalea sp. IMCC44478 TaxID=3459122 RepID=UPI0040430076
MRISLKTLVQDPASRYGRVFDTIIQVLIFLSLAAFAIETIPDLPEQLVWGLNAFEYFCVAVFSLEYLLRIFTAPKPLRYITSFYGIIDLLAVLPFYLNLVIDLRSLRAFRVFRLFRAFKLVRYNKALQRMHIAAGLIKEEMVLFLMITLITIFLAAAGIYFFENEAQPEVFSSIFHSIWWAIVTLTTVGYGDVYPITMGGRIFTFFVLLVGIGIVTVPAGLMASALSKARKIQDKELSELEKERVARD